MYAQLLVDQPFVTRCIAQRLGKCLGISERQCSPPTDNQVLRKAYQLNRQPNRAEVTKLAENIGWTSYNVYKWFRQARNCTKPSKLIRFGESFWRLSYHFTSLAFGIVIFYQESLLNISRCFNGSQSDSHSTAIVAYWSTQLGYCTSAVLLQLISAIRKDTTFAHATFFCHLATTTLLAISYVTKMLKIGTVVMLVHDICDMLVEVAYLLDYITYSGLSQAMFIVFAITFFVTRLLIYPFWILRSVLFVLPESVTPSPALNLTLVLLVVIQMVHVYRFQHIAVMAGRSLKGRTAKQITELSSDSDSAKKNE
ncbi:hypothetical protein EMCRGX_G012762 [Ephydatia muelleri]